jgi:hypothetical protein
MINVSTAWVGPKKAAFLAIPQIAPLFTRVEAVHHALIVARDGASADAILASLNDQADVLDDRHDHLVRAIYFLLLAARSFELGHDSGDEAKAEEITRASNALLPQQLRAIQASYQSEAGNASQLEALADKEFPALLGTIQLKSNITALDLIHEIGTVGRNLGSVEDQRSLAAAQLKKDTVTPSETRRRMRDWAQVAEAILINLEMASASAEAIEALRQPLLDAADKALTRRREKRAHRADANTDAPTNTDPPKPNGP